ncbi:hypothetical protein ACT3CE_16175 [Marinifilum sp. RC60d5]|uniref:hypothetical protein n=1 Tax=Marinifilum sp. RC60d5 TaxID=3458414 RepID=UPI00403581BF
MYQKDFILRMIEMIAEVIARIIGLIKKGDPEKASQLLENAYHDFLKKDASFFRSIPKEELSESLLSQHNYTNGHLQILAELFIAEAELQISRNQNQAGIEYFEKSLILLRFIEQESTDFSLSLIQKINGLEKRLELINS